MIYYSILCFVVRSYDFFNRCSFFLFVTVVPSDYFFCKNLKSFVKVLATRLAVLPGLRYTTIYMCDTTAVLVLVAVLATGTCARKPLDLKVFLRPRLHRIVGSPEVFGIGIVVVLFPQ